MKKVLLFLLCALVSIGTRAQDVTQEETGSSKGVWQSPNLTIQIDKDPHLDNFTSTESSVEGLALVDWINTGTLYIEGTPISQKGINRISTAAGDNKIITFDISKSSIYDKDPLTSVPVEFHKMIFAPGTTLPSDKVLATGKNLQYAYSAPVKDGVEINLYVGTVTKLSDITELSEVTLDANTIVYLTGDTQGKISEALQNAGVLKSNIKKPVGNNTLATDQIGSIDSFKAAVESYKQANDNSLDGLTELEITGGEISQEIYDYIATNFKSLTKVDLTNAILPDSVRLKDGTEVYWQILILPKDTKVSPNFTCYPELKYAMGGGFEKIWLISRYDPNKEGSIKLKDSGIDDLLPLEITTEPTDGRRIGAAFVGNVTADDIIHFVGDGKKLQYARIWHLGMTEGLDEDAIGKLGNATPGGNSGNTVTGFVLPRGMNVKTAYEKMVTDGDNRYDANIGNIYSLSKEDDGLTMTALIKNTETFDIARFTTTVTKKVKLISNGDVEIDKKIIEKLSSTKHAVVADLSEMKFPDRSSENIPDDQILSGVTTGTIRRIRIPSGIHNFTIDTYKGTTFGVVARIKTLETPKTAVVYQRVPGTLYDTRKYRSADILTEDRIRYRGDVIKEDLDYIFTNNQNIYYDLSDLKIVTLTEEGKANWETPEKFIGRGETDATHPDCYVKDVEDISAFDMSVIKNNKVEYIALPTGTKIPDAWKLGFDESGNAKKPSDCGSLKAVGVLNSEKGTDSENDATRNTISIHSYEGGNTAPVVEMLTDATDFPTISTQSNNVAQNSDDAQKADNADDTETKEDAGNANGTTDTSNKPVRHLVMSGELFLCDIANSKNYMLDDGHSNIQKVTDAVDGMLSAFEKKNGTTATAVTKKNVVTADNGETSANGTVSASAAFNADGEYKNIFGFTTADFTDAIFTPNTDMAFSYAGGYSELTDIKLPESEKMTEIPQGTLNQMKMTELCIPANYTTIRRGAFYLMGNLKKITTTRSGKEGQDGNITDRGDNTIVLSFNVEQIETGAFWGIEKMYDVYVLAEKAPKCAAGSFPSTMCYGNNGFTNVHPVQRINYDNGGRIIGMLHYPRVCRGTDEELKYTDITREYTLFDETGATNGYGEPLTWPRHEEFGKAWNQAQAGVLWDGTTKYNKEDYQGWHEFVLAANYYRKRTSDDVSMRDYSRFKENDWYTICVPYNITRSTLKKLLGADAGEKVDLKSGETITAGEDGLGPDVRTLVKVKRSNENSLVTFVFSDNLMERKADNAVNYTGKGTDIKLSEDGKTYTYTEPEVWKGANGTEEDDPIIIKGGYPYIIKPYLSAEKRQKFETEDFILELPNNVATKNLPSVGYYYLSLEKALTAAPCPVHKVHAIDEDKTTDSETVYVYEGGDETKPYFYHFAGTYSYSGQRMPKYCFFLATKKNSEEPAMFYRATSENFPWTRCTAIMAGRSEAKITGGEYTSDGTTDKGTSITNIYIDFKCNDDSFNADFSTGNVKGAKFAMAFGDEGGSTTGITETDCNKGVTGNGGGYVYSISGKRMGTSLDGLPKGIYIKDGKKYVVNK